MPEKVTGRENLRKGQDMISEGTRGAFYVKSGQQTSYQADRDGVNRLSMTEGKLGFRHARELGRVHYEGFT